MALSIKKHSISNIKSPVYTKGAFRLKKNALSNGIPDGQDSDKAGVKQSKQIIKNAGLMPPLMDNGWVNLNSGFGYYPDDWMRPPCNRLGIHHNKKIHQQREVYLE